MAKNFSGETFWASMSFGDNRLYVTSQKGKTFAFAPDPSAFELLATSDLGEHINATPALSDGQLFIRTWDALYCIAK